MTSILRSAEFADPVAERSITDIKALGDLLHGLFFDNQRTECFVLSLWGLDGMQKVLLVIACIHF